MCYFLVKVLVLQYVAHLYVLSVLFIGDDVVPCCVLIALTLD